MRKVNYLRFALGEEQDFNTDKIKLLDYEVPVGSEMLITQMQWHRSTIIKRQAIASANYLCEYDPAHKTFIANSTKNNYMEGHHAIPIKLQEKFPCSLDVYANIVCLCPICHRLLHYGINENKEKILSKIYIDREDRLSKSGIKMNKKEFLEVVSL